MDRPPVLEQDPKQEEFAATEEAVQERSDLGGESLTKAVKDKRITEDTARAVDLRGQLENTMAEAKPEVIPMDYSVIESRIATLGQEIQASKAQGWLRRTADSWNRGVKADTVELLQKGLRMIKGNPARQGEYMKALQQGGVELAAQYVEEAAKGNWRNVEDGKLVNISGRNTKSSILNQ